VEAGDVSVNCVRDLGARCARHYRQGEEKKQWEDPFAEHR
jgi:hypothetical protein